MKKIILFATIALTVVLVLTSCNKKSDNDQIIGTWNWEGYYENGGKYRVYSSQEYDYWTFNKDGSVVNRYKEDNAEEEVEQGTWRLDGNILILSNGNEFETWEISFPDKNTMHWIEQGYPEDIEVLKRQ